MSKKPANQPKAPTKAPLPSGVRCLITGFDGFQSRANNPSQQMVELLPNVLKAAGGGTFPLQRLVLETCEASWTALRPRLKDCDVLIMTGVASRRSLISIERFALNIRDYRVEDNHGHQFKGTPIDKKGPAAMATDVDLLQLEKRLLKKGYPCEISNHAGTFICNDIYYQALKHRASKGVPRVVLFVHIPMPGRYTRTMLTSKASAVRKRGERLKNRQQQLRSIGDAILEIAQFCCEEVSPG